MNRESALNILVVGCCGVGKTSYINQLTNSGPFPASNHRSSKNYKVTPFVLETTGGPVHFNLRDNIERGDTHMLKHDPEIDGVIFMYDVNRSGSFTWLLMRYKEYLKDKHAIITFVGNKAEEAWLPTRQISVRYAREVAHQWDTGSYHINTRCKIDILLPLLYLARKIIKIEELVPLHPTSPIYKISFTNSPSPPSQALLKPPPTAPQLPLPPPPLPATHLSTPPPHYSALATTNPTSPLIFLAERIRSGDKDK